VRSSETKKEAILGDIFYDPGLLPPMSEIQQVSRMLPESSFFFLFFSFLRCVK